jgi:hypothetical protein
MNSRSIFNHIILFVLLIIFQAFIFNYVLVMGIGTPFIYPLFILLLPIQLPATSIILLSFGTGLLIDVLSNGGGIHAASLTVMGFLRKPVLNLLMPQSGYDKNELPNLQQQGARWFFLYTTLLLLFHHICLFMLEVFSFDNFPVTVYRTFFSCALSILLTWLIALFLLPSKKIR